MESETGNGKCILALESDKRDIFEMQRTFQLAGITDKLVLVRNRDESLCYLKGIGIYIDRVSFPLPRLMLIDVCAPICGGLEILEWVKASLPSTLAVATGRDLSPQLIQEAYDLGTHAVFQKPGDLQELSNLIKTLDFVPSTNTEESTREYHG